MLRRITGVGIVIRARRAYVTMVRRHWRCQNYVTIPLVIYHVSRLLSRDGVTLVVVESYRWLLRRQWRHYVIVGGLMAKTVCCQVEHMAPHHWLFNVVTIIVDIEDIILT